jgi:hypothetical protein
MTIPVMREVRGRVPTRIPPTPADADLIAAGTDPVIRNLQITLAYYDIAIACRGPLTLGANWCTFATWASRQAGHTIRGEDLRDNLKRRSLLPTPILAVNERIAKWLIRRGLFDPNTRLGRLASAVGSPIRGLETGSQEIADGNRKVFEEIGREFARFLEARVSDTVRDDAALEAFCDTLRRGPPPDGQDRLREAFSHYYAAKFTADATERAQLEHLANVLVGFHEQIRLQAQIERGMTDPVVDEARWGLDLLTAIFKSAPRWWSWARTAVASFLRVLLRPARRVIHRLIRETVTEALMTLTIAGQRYSLAAPIGLAPAQSLRQFTNPDLIALMATLPPAVGAEGNVGATDWSDLGQRMRYISYLFRVYHERDDVCGAPFSPEQITAIRAGRIPDGGL